MNDEYYKNGQYFEYPRRPRRGRSLRDSNAPVTERSRPYMWPNSEMNFSNGESTFSIYSGRHRSVDDLFDSKALESPTRMIKVKPYKDIGQADVSIISSSERSGSSTRSRSGLSQVFTEYSEKCSLVGVPYIRGAKSPAERAVWSLLLLIAIGVMILHLSMLFSSYFSYEKHTKITLSFSNLKFPAVTFCNVNAMRFSKVDNASKELQDLIEKASPNSMKEMVSKWHPKYQMKPGYYPGQEGSSDSIPPPAQLRSTNFLDSMPMNLTDCSPRADVKSFYQEKHGDSWKGECEPSTFDIMQETFKDLWVAMSLNLRTQLGHQIQDMLLQCSFAGGQCLMGNFTPVQSASYGNCYKIEYDKWVARRNGPDEGLELILFLETEEYVPGITNEKGIQLVIHEQNTMAFPDNEGIAIAAGMQTVIGLKQIKVSRLGDPYGTCTEPEDFMKKYGVKYTRQTCQKVCEEGWVRDKCNCYDESAQQTNSILNTTSGLGPCRNLTEMTCLADVQWNFDGDNTACGCNSPCTEQQFDKTISSRQWPSPSFANVMVDMICKEKPGPICRNLRENKSEMGINEEFIKLNIYFEDLNYEELTEAADYELTQFLSDVGGTIGLYIGLSVLGIFELFHLIADIFNHVCSAKGKKVEQIKYG